jgi:hypothetical protein
LTQTHDLAGFKDRLGDLLAVDKGAVGRIEVVDNHVRTAQEDFAVMTGYRRLGNRKGVIFEPPNGGFIPLELVRKPGETFAEHNKSGHRLVGRRYYRQQVPQVKRICALKRGSLPDGHE